MERTSKRWKGLQAIGLVGFAAGLAVAGIAAKSSIIPLLFGGVVLAVGGLAVAFIATIGAWWQHG